MRTRARRKSMRGKNKEEGVKKKKEGGGDDNDTDDDVDDRRGGGRERVCVSKRTPKVLQVAPRTNTCTC